jgi:hypothetical protein
MTSPSRSVLLCRGMQDKVGDPRSSSSFCLNSASVMSAKAAIGYINERSEVQPKSVTALQFPSPTQDEKSRRGLRSNCCLPACLIDGKADCVMIQIKNTNMRGASTQSYDKDALVQQIGRDMAPADIFPSISG